MEIKIRIVCFAVRSCSERCYELVASLLRGLEKGGHVAFVPGKGLRLDEARERWIMLVRVAVLMVKLMVPRDRQ